MLLLTIAASQQKALTNTPFAVISNGTHEVVYHPETQLVELPNLEVVNDFRDIGMRGILNECTHRTALRQ